MSSNFKFILKFHFPGIHKRAALSYQKIIVLPARKCTIITGF